MGKPYTPKKNESSCSSVFADRKLGAQPLMYSAPGAQTPVWNVPKLGKLPYHMTCAGDMWAELEATLTDVSFLEAKVGPIVYSHRMLSLNSSVWSIGPFIGPFIGPLVHSLVCCIGHQTVKKHVFYYS